MIEELERAEVDHLARRLLDRAAGRGVHLIWRAQSCGSWSALVRGGRIERVAASRFSGHALWIAEGSGRTAFASRDDFEPEAAERLLDRLIENVLPEARLRGSPLPPTTLAPEQARLVPDTAARFAGLDLEAVRLRLLELERICTAGAPKVRLRLAFGAELDSWRIQRSDGSDVRFSIPRCSLRLVATAGRDGGKHSVGAAVASPDPGLLWQDQALDLFFRRARHAVALAQALPDAPHHPAGVFPTVIDYALAKGLAHEAFGHAAEADGLRSSVLAREGRFRVGDRVGAEHVSIVDEPLEGDHAWQPFSPNGVRRRRTVIVERGRLRQALADAWSAAAAGVENTGAERAESYRCPPLPRMSNIRIEVATPLPAPGDFEDYDAEALRERLAAEGILRRHPRLAFLSGYSGGQVNTTRGDFVFQCKAIYELSQRGVRLFKPAIFAGSMFGALEAIREAFGPLCLDAIGTCGKWGQRVPSSGGSHYFLVLDPHPSFRLGGN